MRKRTMARESALKILYAIDITKDAPDKCINNFWLSQDKTAREIRNYADDIVLGVCNNRDRIDELVSECATNWELGRMAVIDRNILRLGAYELIFMDEIPPKVAINEAIDIAKRYGDKDSGKFVNGVLDKINKDKRKPSE
ncbi:MAG: transcription antitermination factor NusB [Candidatus Omnitrophica bacterium]|nr:transcription antitermination factor NusB [Candidatus Omnitrophota bacterium]MBU1037542.1 transcription antitermination factor NusB [Candidatus Omnitrophota bacterium]MBU1808264.1 transcription antitermination factor NusB [Candidatus Omnitrophota bacterium]